MGDWSIRELVETDREWLCTQFRAWGDDFTRDARTESLPRTRVRIHRCTARR